MSHSGQFFKAIGVTSFRGDLENFSKLSGVSKVRLKYFNENNILPSGDELEKILKATGIPELLLKLKMGRLDKDVIEAIQNYADDLLPLLTQHQPNIESPRAACSLEFETNLGKLYQGDCYELLKTMSNDSIDLVFADPPFNLSKLYPSEINDNLKAEKYLSWSQEWLRESVRILKPGGTLFLWNLPKWNVALTGFLEGLLTLKHWIGVDIKYSLPIQGRLYPSHYSLLYYVKGDKPNTFHPDRLPMQVCSKCYGDLKDYGGYKNKMNPLGVSISDIWTDISPVRHAKYKRRAGSNELSLKLLDRVIEMSSNEGDLIFDPFGGSGTTYMAAELKRRRWIGCEIGSSDVIIERFSLIEDERKILDNYRSKINALFPYNVKLNREKRGLWTCESVKSKP